ncbi:hypothetical protein APHAL10511_003769 [Amanita phalloides]|nr:hypothetical protein APHAL10511_003769 [Amanita phalloides]
MAMTPYLLLPHLLSLAWLAYPIISLLFVAFRLLLSLDASESDIAAAKSDLLASCKAAEHAATSAASLPRYMAAATNKQFSDAVNGTIAGARDVLILSLTVMEVVINFIVDIYRSTFLCFLELVVMGSLQLLIKAAQEINNLVNSAASSLRTTIQSDIVNANNVINNAINAINKVNPFGKITAPQITVPSLDGLQNITLPSSFQDTLVQLNNSIPSVSVLKQTINDILDKPFELVKGDINATFANITFDASILPVPSQNSVTFCDKLDLSVVDDLGAELVKMAKIGVAILVLAAIFLTALNCLLIWYRWLRLKRHLEYTRQAWMTDPTLNHTRTALAVPEITLSDHNLMMLLADMHHPLITRIINNLSTKFRLTPSQHTKIRWFFHYIFHPPALACFLIGFFGLLCIEIQLLALGPLDAYFSNRVSSATTDFSHTIATAINASMYNQSATYANDVNSRVDVIQTTINDGLFSWVNGTTTTLNNTVNAFYSDIQDVVTTLFNGTFFEDPAQDFIKCFIGSKVDAIEKALTFLHNNLYVAMPQVNESVLVLSPNSVSEVTQPIARAAVGSGNNGTNSGIVGKLISKYEASLRKERFMFAIFMGIWAFVVFLAICILLWNTYGPRWLEERRRRKWQREQRSGVDRLVIPFKLRATDEKKLHNNPSKLIVSPVLFFPPRETSPRTFAVSSANRNRSPSPSPPSPVKHSFEPTHPRSRSDETLVMGPNAANEDAGRLLTAEKSNTESLSSKTIDRLRTIGRKKGPGKGDAQQAEKVNHTEDGDDVERGGRTAWLGRMASKLGKNASASETISQSALKEGQTSSAHVAPASKAGGLKSRWSNETMTPDIKASPWKFGSTNRRAAPPVPTTYTHPLRPVQDPLPPRYTAYVPSEPTYGERPRSSISAQPTIAPVPLHHGFVNATRPFSQSPGSAGSGITPFPPPPSRYNGNGITKPSLKLFTSGLSTRNAPNATSSPSSAIPDSGVLPSIRPLRISSVVPYPPAHNQKQGQDHVHTHQSNSSLITSLLTTTHARHLSRTTNPFISPFDDEHRVKIQTENPARSSVMTNPFSSPAGVAL